MDFQRRTQLYLLLDIFTVSVKDCVTELSEANSPVMEIVTFLTVTLVLLVAASDITVKVSAVIFTALLVMASHSLELAQL